MAKRQRHEQLAGSARARAAPDRPRLTVAAGQHVASRELVARVVALDPKRPQLHGAIIAAVRGGRVSSRRAELRARLRSRTRPARTAAAVRARPARVPAVLAARSAAAVPRLARPGRGSARRTAAPAFGWDAIAASRSRDISDGTVGGLTVCARIPRSSATSQIRSARRGSPTTIDRIWVGEPLMSNPSWASSSRSAAALTPQAVDQPGPVLEQVERRQCAAHGRGRRGRREQQGPRRVDQVSRHRAIARDEPAIGAERVPERSHDHVHLVVQADVGERAPSAGTQRTDAVGLVDDQPEPVSLRQFDDLGQRRHVAVDREHAVGDDQRSAAVRLLRSPTRGARDRSGHRRTSQPRTGGIRRRSRRGSARRRRPRRPAARVRRSRRRWREIQIRTAARLRDA